MNVDQFNSPPGDYTIYDLIQEFEISLYFSTVLLKYLTVIIGLFTVLVMIMKCSMHSICIAAKSFGDVSVVISKFKKGKAVGLDGISGESLINWNSKLSLYLSMWFQAMLIHGYVPHSLMKTKIIPLVKNKCGALSDLNNYRPVAIATTISKVFETILLNRCENYLYPSDNQFGFKAGHSTDMCIHTLRNSIEYFKIRNTTVFITFFGRKQGFRPFKSLVSI